MGERERERERVGGETTGVSEKWASVERKTRHAAKGRGWSWRKGMKDAGTGVYSWSLNSRAHPRADPVRQGLPASWH